MIDIRAFHESDEEPVIALWTSVFDYPAPHNQPAAVIRCKLSVQRDLFFVALLDGKLVGTVMGGYDGHRGWVYSLAVAPGVRRRGIGTSLIRRSSNGSAVSTTSAPGLSSRWPPIPTSASRGTASGCARRKRAEYREIARRAAHRRVRG